MLTYCDGTHTLDLLQRSTCPADGTMLKPPQPARANRGQWRFHCVVSFRTSRRINEVGSSKQIWLSVNFKDNGTVIYYCTGNMCKVSIYIGVFLDSKLRMEHDHLHPRHQNQIKCINCQPIPGFELRTIGYPMILSPARLRSLEGERWDHGTRHDCNALRILDHDPGFWASVRRKHRLLARRRRASPGH